MKYFILILISLITLIIFASCGLIHTTKVDKEEAKFAKEYGGIYVFDKEIRDEIIQREKEREEAEQKVTTGDTFWEQREAIDKNLPQILSNGCKYGFSFYGSYDDEYLKPYYQKIKEYMGEEAFNKLKGGLKVTSYYVDKDNREIPITVYTAASASVTTYGLYGDEGAGFRLTRKDLVTLAGSNIFYLKNGKFVKSNEKREGARH
ncbi:TPA: hypothetical protein SHD04_001872 [Campylobacter coli]|nr:hypothetical protein [Campylobacter coli]HEH5389662.1 hypothetical protein [Campylobacter coli]HEH5419217.1 hypothetical protein [Campylobacter coli]HEH5533345.1 hypothetical protein [Campylobacter coli]